MNKVKNILFIMADQLRFDYLSCYGHPHLKTPHIDGLAKKGFYLSLLMFKHLSVDHQEHHTILEELCLAMDQLGIKYLYQ